MFGYLYLKSGFSKINIVWIVSIKIIFGYVITKKKKRYELMLFCPYYFIIVSFF